MSLAFKIILLISIICSGQGFSSTYKESVYKTPFIWPQTHLYSLSPQSEIYKTDLKELRTDANTKYKSNGFSYGYDNEVNYNYFLNIGQSLTISFEKKSFQGLEINQQDLSKSQKDAPLGRTNGGLGYF